MKLKTNRLFVLLLILLPVILAGCRNPSDKLIQGTWYHDNEHLYLMVAEKNNLSEWTFDQGTFVFTSCCFNNDISTRGYYVILKTEGNIITLKMHHTHGDFEGSQYEIQVKVNEDDTLIIFGGGPYIRVER